MWLAPIHDTAFVQRVLKSIEGQEKAYGTWTRIHGMLSLAANVSRRLPGRYISADVKELEDPFYITANKMFGTCHSASASTTKVL